jgi:hypothetical protein
MLAARAAGGVLAGSTLVLSRPPAAVRRPLRPFRWPLWLRFTYVTSVLVKKKYSDATDAGRPADTTALRGLREASKGVELLAIGRVSEESALPHGLGWCTARSLVPAALTQEPPAPARPPCDPSGRAGGHHAHQLPSHGTRA